MEDFTSQDNRNKIVSQLNDINENKDNLQDDDNESESKLSPFSNEESKLQKNYNDF